MLYLVYCDYDNMETYDCHQNWTVIYGVVDSVERAKSWIEEIKKEYEEDCERDTIKFKKRFPNSDFDFSVYNYDEQEESDGTIVISFRVERWSEENLDCIFTIQPSEFNKRLN